MKKQLDWQHRNKSKSNESSLYNQDLGNSRDYMRAILNFKFKLIFLN